MPVVNWTKKARKHLAKIPKQDASKIISTATTLENWPKVRQVKSFVSRSDYRLRVGRYRIIFAVKGKSNFVNITVEGIEIRREHTYKSSL